MGLRNHELRRIHPLVILGVILAVLMVVALAFDRWQDQRRDDRARRMAEEFITQCEADGTC